jgi:hypothetical protein
MNGRKWVITNARVTERGDGCVELYCPRCKEPRVLDTKGMEPKMVYMEIAKFRISHSHVDAVT